ncbi:MAG TPA: SCP2 sterol-binding domain-containing protein [Acidimicrobiia bacterium]|nr:SCP2 sterol-binding domain-containing protein [Acidimicrobiia bacterium]
MAPEVRTFDEATTPEDLAALIDGLSDDEIHERASAAGVDVILERIFATMESMFRPDRAQGHDGVVQWEVDDGVTTRAYHVVMRGGTCRTGVGSAEAPKATLSFTLPNFLRFMAGEMNGIQAFMTGKVRISGDVMYAQRMEGFFRD